MAFSIPKNVNGQFIYLIKYVTSNKKSTNLPQNFGVISINPTLGPNVIKPPKQEHSVKQVITRSMSHFVSAIIINGNVATMPPERKIRFSLVGRYKYHFDLEMFHDMLHQFISLFTDETANFSCLIHCKYLVFYDKIADIPYKQSDWACK